MSHIIQYFITLSHIIQYLNLPVSHFRVPYSLYLRWYINVLPCLTLHSSWPSVCHILDYHTLNVCHYTLPYIPCLTLHSNLHSVSHIIHFLTLRVSNGAENYSTFLTLHSSWHSVSHIIDYLNLNVFIRQKLTFRVTHYTVKFLSVSHITQ